MYGITYNNKHSFKDLGLTVLNTRVIETPSKIKITETLPFSNKSYDFSNLYGGNCYNERQLEYEFLIKTGNNADLEYKKIIAENWLLQLNEKTKLEDDSLKDFYYLAECTNIEFEELNPCTGKLKAYFIAYPFKISKIYEGEKFWNDFDFEKDTLQDAKFNINGSKTVIINNLSIVDVEPIILASSKFVIYLNSKRFVVNSGEAKDYRFKFKKGKNKLTIKGNGSIEFKFRKEVL